MNLWAAIGLCILGVAVADALEALRLYLRGNGAGETHRWPSSLPVGRYAVATVLRLNLGILVVTALWALDIICSETVAFLAGLATLKMSEVFFGYVPTREIYW